MGFKRPEVRIFSLGPKILNFVRNWGFFLPKNTPHYGLTGMRFWEAKCLVEHLHRLLLDRGLHIQVVLCHIQATMLWIVARSTPSACTAAIPLFTLFIVLRLPAPFSSYFYSIAPPRSFPDKTLKKCPGSVQASGDTRRCSGGIFFNTRSCQQPNHSCWMLFPFRPGTS